MSRCSLCLLIALPLIAVAGSAEPPARLSPPQNMLWSWFAEDDFRPAAPSGTGVAWLAMSLQFSRSGVSVAPRAASLRTPRGMYEMAVVRFNFEPSEYPPAGISSWHPRQRIQAEQSILDLVRLTGATSLQLDFDAPESARPFYRDLLRSLRAQLPGNTYLSITALASWCMEPKSWLASLPVDEFVPMVFDMGQSGDAVLTLLKRGGEFPFPGCRTTLGIRQSSSDIPAKPGVRIYRFNGGQPRTGITRRQFRP